MARIVCVSECMSRSIKLCLRNGLEMCIAAFPVITCRPHFIPSAVIAIGRSPLAGLILRVSSSITRKCAHLSKLVLSTHLLRTTRILRLASFSLDSPGDSRAHRTPDRKSESLPGRAPQGVNPSTQSLQACCAAQRKEPEGLAHYAENRTTAPAR